MRSSLSIHMKYEASEDEAISHCHYVKSQIFNTHTHTPLNFPPRQSIHPIMACLGYAVTAQTSSRATRALWDISVLQLIDKLPFLMDGVNLKASFSSHWTHSVDFIHHVLVTASLFWIVLPLSSLILIWCHNGTPTYWYQPCMEQSIIILSTWRNSSCFLHFSWPVSLLRQSLSLRWLYNRCGEQLMLKEFH